MTNKELNILIENTIEQNENFTTTPVTEIGSVCVYCGTETEDMCCGEVHHEMAYETEDGELLLESDLTEEHTVEELWKQVKQKN